MYDRRIKGRTLTFAVSGKLWEGSLVMIDEETKSLWSHLLGEAMRGELTGAVLTQIPSVMTEWRQWRKRHPTTTAVLLSKTSIDYSTPNYRVGRFLLIGLSDQQSARAWRYADLPADCAINDAFADEPVLVARNSQHGTVVIFSRTLDKRVLTFDSTDGRLVDRETHSTWDVVSGEAVDGPLKGRTLKLLPGTVSFEQAWQSFHPKSTHWRPETRKDK